jgi:hypothetical protein
VSTVEAAATAVQLYLIQNIVLRNILLRVKYYRSKIFILKYPERKSPFNAGRSAEAILNLEYRARAGKRGVGRRCSGGGGCRRAYGVNLVRIVAWPRACARRVRRHRSPNCCLWILKFLVRSIRIGPTRNVYSAASYANNKQCSLL